MASFQEHVISAKAQLEESDDLVPSDEARARAAGGDLSMFAALLEQRVALIGRALDDVIDALRKLAS